MAEDQRSGFVDVCPVFIDRCITLAAFTILKIVRSSLLDHVDREAAEQAYFSAIHFTRRATLQSDDLGARGTTLLSQLWTSKNIFTYANGKVDGLRSRIRSRLAMSVVFDCFWWWREEFGGQPSPYGDDGPDSTTRGVKAHSTYYLGLNANRIHCSRKHNRHASCR